jgi:EAL domain-containing protein (putative c-di-GMP-specific phosphodiesterase class I)
MVKIDRSFIRCITNNRESQLFLGYLLGLRKGSSSGTIAEEVETEDEASPLREEEVDSLQGHLYGMASLDPPGLQPAA